MKEQVKTKDNVRFEEPLSEIVTVRITSKEFLELSTISRDNYISTSELLRNLIREHVHTYALSEDLKKNLHISNEIDRFLLVKRLISSRNETNLSKMREILSDFEAYLDVHPKHIDYVELRNKRIELDKLLKLIYEEDTFLSTRIDSQVRRLFKSKHFKQDNYNTVTE